MPISEVAGSIEEDKNERLARREARSVEELVKALLGIALQRSRTSDRAALFDENGRTVRDVELS